MLRRAAHRRGLRRLHGEPRGRLGCPRLQAGPRRRLREGHRPQAGDLRVQSIRRRRRNVRVRLRVGLWVCGGVGVLMAACAAPAPAVAPARVPAIPIAPSISFTPTPRPSDAPPLILHPNLADAQNDSFALLAGRPPFTVDFSAEVAESLPRPLHYQWDRDGDGMIDSTDADPPPITFTTPGVYTATLALT